MDTSRPERATAAALVALGAFQFALAVGAPWGRAAYGGTRHGTLPDYLRSISGAAALGYGTGAVLVLRGSGSPRARARAFTTLSVFMSIGAVAKRCISLTGRASHLDAGDGGDDCIFLAFTRGSGVMSAAQLSTRVHREAVPEPAGVLDVHVPDEERLTTIEPGHRGRDGADAVPVCGSPAGRTTASTVPIDRTSLGLR